MTQPNPELDIPKTLAEEEEYNPFSSEDLSEAITVLLHQEPFYGYPLLAISYTEARGRDQKVVPTAGIDKRGRLMFNPNFLGKLTLRERCGVLKHELMHLLYRHPLYMEGKADRFKHNIACDIAINQLLPEIPKTGDFRGLFPKDFNLPLGLGSDEYYEMLPDGEKLDKLLAKLGVQRPEHYWEISPEMADLVAQTLESSIEREEERGRGNIPAHFRKLLDKLRQLRQISWKQQLRHLVKMAMRGEWRIRWKRPDRRLGQVPSRQRDRKFKIGVAIDTSGSTMAFREAFAGELVTIRAQTGSDLVVVECDCEVGSTYEVKGTTTWKPPTEMSGGGGTAFQPAIDWFEKHQRTNKVGCVIYLTDGFGENPQIPPSFPTIWVSTTDTKAAGYGRQIRIKAD